MGDKKFPTADELNELAKQFLSRTQVDALAHDMRSAADRGYSNLSVIADDYDLDYLLPILTENGFGYQLYEATDELAPDSLVITW